MADMQKYSGDEVLSSSFMPDSETDDNGKIATSDAQLEFQATAEKQDIANSSLDSIDNKIDSLATSAKQDIGNTSLNSIDKNLADRTKHAFLAALNDVDVLVIAEPCRLLSVGLSNRNASARYMQIFDQTTAPVAGEVPLFSFTTGAGNPNNPVIVIKGNEFWGDDGFQLINGLAVGASTTAGIFTPATVTDHIIEGVYFYGV